MGARRQVRFSSLMLVVLLLAATMAFPAQAAPLLQQTCFDIVVNGGFETRTGWVLGGGPTPPQYVFTPVKSGSWAMQAGNPNLLPTTEAFSSFHQPLTIPANAVSAELSFWVWTYTEANPGNDRQQALVLPPGANLPSSLSSGVVWEELTNSGAYQLIRRSLSSHIGRSFELTFSVYNDGIGGRTWMFVDDVTLTVCLPVSTPTPTLLPGPTITPLPTLIPSPIPPNCMDILANGDFEWDGAWRFGDTPIPPFYAGPPNPVFNGSRSMALGAVLPGAPSNVASFSSIQQSVTLPATAQTARIRFYYYPSSTAAAGGLSRQELVLLDPLRWEETIETPWRVTENANRWLYKEIDLTRYLGRTLTFYFNARNAGDGTRTSMFLDYVQVLACDFMAIMPLHDSAAPYQEALSSANDNRAPDAPTPILFPTDQVPPPTAATGPQQTVIAVGSGPAPLPETTPGAPPTSPTEPPRRDQPSRFSLDELSSPWLVIFVISGIVLLAVVLALLFFRGEKEETGSPS